MRVISGFLKGRTIKGFDLKGTRPTMDRIKESIFGMIQSSVSNATTLDLFAGTGNLGIEAISNGAKLCYFVDKNPLAVKTIKDNCETFQISDKCEILLSDYKKALDYFENTEVKFDIIFIDPPYKETILISVLKMIVDKNILNNNALIIVEMEENSIKEAKIQGLNLIKRKKYGSKYVNLYEKK